MVEKAQHIYTQAIENPAHIRFLSKRPHALTKIDDNISMGSTIAGEMNIRNWLLASKVESVSLKTKQTKIDTQTQYQVVMNF